MTLLCQAPSLIHREYNDLNCCKDESIKHRKHSIKKMKIPIVEITQHINEDLQITLYLAPYNLRRTTFVKITVSVITPKFRS